MICEKFMEYLCKSLLRRNSHYKNIDLSLTNPEKIWKNE